MPSLPHHPSPVAPLIAVALIGVACYPRHVANAVTVAVAVMGLMMMMMMMMTVATTAADIPQAKIVEEAVLQRLGVSA